MLAPASCGTASTTTLAQQEHGDGWRLLLDDTVGSPYEVHAATDATQFSLLREQLDQEGSPPQVDFASEVVVHFGAVVSGSCPEILFEDVVIDLGEGLVHGEFGSSIQGSGTRDCTADARPHAYVVAVERAVLPPSPFTIQLGSLPGL